MKGKVFIIEVWWFLSKGFSCTERVEKFIEEHKRVSSKIKWWILGVERSLVVVVY